MMVVVGMWSLFEGDRFQSFLTEFQVVAKHYYNLDVSN
jgi:hypothetical protein